MLVLHNVQEFRSLVKVDALIIVTGVIILNMNLFVEEIDNGTKIDVWWTVLTNNLPIHFGAKEVFTDYLID